jgi:hypothetical protein
VAPTREPLPDAAAVIPEPQSCAFLVGEGRGVSVEDVINDSGADGVLEIGDLLVGINGAQILNADQLRAALSEQQVGDRVAVDVIRGGEEVQAEVVLGPNPDAPERPLLGVMVMTDFERVTPADIGSDLDLGPLSRTVGVGSSVYLFDPIAGRWADLEAEIPDGLWVAAGRSVLTMENPTSPDSALVDARTGDRLVFDIGDWWGVQILGTIGSDVLVSGARLVAGETEVYELAVLAIDFDARAAHWIWQVSTGIGVPGAIYPTPDGTRLLLMGQDQEDQVLHHMIMSAEGLPMRSPEQLTAAEGALAVGWFDDQSFLIRTADSSLQLVDASTGTVSDLELPAALGEVSRIWPVGDGIHLLADTGSSLVRFNVEGSTEIRTMADHCQIELVGSAGWTTTG